MSDDGNVRAMVRHGVRGLLPRARPAARLGAGDALLRVEGCGRSACARTTG
ncbi:MAG: hypothetical protein ACYDCT_08265 [Dehalococcoidia bacterium]